MAFPVAATAISLPLGFVQSCAALGSIIKGASPNNRLQKWSHRVAEISLTVADNHQHIPAKALNHFLDLIARFMQSKLLYEKDVKRGYKAWYGQGKTNGDEFREASREAWLNGMSLSTMAAATRQYCELHHKNPPRNSRGQCAICFPEEISATLPHDNPQDLLLSWATFIRSTEAREVLEQEPPTYSESEVDDSVIDALQELPREEISTMWQEYYNLRGNDIQPTGTEYNPWVSLADLHSSRASVLRP